ncbi:MAG TPA: diguanylate cyclase [Candidatus Acidoferrales bacterium]
MVPPPGGDAGEFLLDLLIDSLEQLEPAHQGPFLQKFLKSLASVEVSEEESIVHWDEVLRRRNELADRLGRPISLRTAAVDYFGSGFILRNPILLEYNELKRLRRSAATDSLTGLYNRRLFDEHLARELNRSRRYDYPMTLVLFDLRNFKQANDAYGHPVGDAILRALASACTENIRGADYACRIGGDEFAVILPQAEAASGRLLAQRIVQTFEQGALGLAPQIEVGLDFGLATFPEDGDTGEGLIELGDRRLYEYKNQRKPGNGVMEPPPPPPPPSPPKSATPQPPEPPAARPSRPARPAPMQSGPEPKGEEPKGNEPKGRRNNPESSAVPLPVPTTAAVPAPIEYTAPVAVEVTTSQRRRYARISLAGTNAYGVLKGGFGTKVAPVLDLGFGGVSLLLDEPQQLPESLAVRLQVSVLPAAEYKITRIYTQRLPQGLWRIGCRFAT